MQSWIKSTNIYEVNLRQYTQEGTINAFARHLPRLKEMGVETLWFMPITPIAEKNRKGSLGSYYACSDYTAVAKEFGTMQDFKTFVATAHKMGFKVILDWVANHTGWDHAWTVSHPEWYKKDEATRDFKKASGMDDIIELDFTNIAMRQAMIDAMAFWITETNIDGFRCDLAFWVELNFWKQAKTALHEIKDLFWLAEADALEHPEYMQVFDAAYTWRWMHASEKFYKAQINFGEWKEVLQQYLQAPGYKAWFTSNHDENSWNGTEYEKYGEMAAALAVFSCTWPGLPLIYSGQELPNTKRLAFFEKDIIEWKEPCSLHDFYQTLLTVRKQSPALWADGGLQILNAPAHCLFFRRYAGEDEMLVVLNLSSMPTTLVLPSAAHTGYQNVFEETEHFTAGTSVSVKEWAFLLLSIRRS